MKITITVKGLRITISTIKKTASSSPEAVAPVKG